MTTKNLPFYDRVEDALHDHTLQTALGRATTRFIVNRDNAMAALDDAEALRDQARAIRAKALARLDELLARLADNVEARGGHVCWAEDGAAARRYIVDLARDRGVKLIVKSKSMAAEEIHLNQALEAAGLEVAETDLGNISSSWRARPPRTSSRRPSTRPASRSPSCSSGAWACRLRWMFPPWRARPARRCGSASSRPRWASAASTSASPTAARSHW